MDDNKKSTTIWLRPSVISRMDGWLEADNCQSRSEFVDKALRFYMGYLGTEDNTTSMRDALAWIDDAGIACFETLIPKRQDILNAKSTRPRGSRLHEYRDLAAELKQTMRQLKDKEEDL